MAPDPAALPPGAPHVEINPRLLAERLSHNVTVILRRAAIALRGADEGSLEGLGVLRGSWVGFDGPLFAAGKESEVRQDARHWILTCALRDMVGYAEIALIEAFDLASLARHAQTGQVQMAALHGPHARAVAAFNRLNFPDKVAALTTALAPVEAPSLLAHFETLRTLRNSLEHDSAGVDAKRCGPDGFMRVRWRRLHIWVRCADGSERPVEFGDSGAAAGGGTVIDPSIGEQLMRGMRDRELVLTPGSRIELSTVHLAEICLTLRMLGDELSNAARARLEPALGGFPVAPLEALTRPAQASTSTDATAAGRAADGLA